MEQYDNAESEWNRLNNLRGGMLQRLERLAKLTIPSVLPPSTYNTEQEQLTNGYTSLGAQAATHLINKLMLTMFAPSRPFMKLDMDRDEKMNLMQQLQIQEDLITDALSMGEQSAMGVLEQAGQRQQLFEVVSHLAVVGNVLMDLSGDDINVIGIRDYVCRRNAKGKMTTLVIKERYRYEELEDDAKAAFEKGGGTCRPTDDVDLFTWVRLKGGKYHSTVWVGKVQLPQEFSSTYTVENLPWKVLAWRLPARQHYGVGRAEDYANDLAEHEGLSQALSEGAALATSFKWLANPGGITRPEDVTQSANGAVIPGAQNDMSLLYANIGQQLQTVMSIKQDVARRIGQGFLLNSAVTREAERVTAEEIRIQAQELESSLGGTYSRLALDIQQPLANWLLKKAEVKIQGTKIKPVIITGLDALSRNADRERMLTFLSDVAALDGLAPETRMKLRETNIIADMAAGAGVERGRYVASEQEIAERQAQAKQEQADELVQAAAIGVAADQAMNTGEQR